MKLIVFSLSFCSFIFGCIWVILFLTEEIRPNQKKQEVKLVAVAGGVIARYYDENNQLKQIINSQKVREYNGDKGTFFEIVSLEGIDNNQLVLKGNSKKAWMASHRDTVNFSEDVKLVDMPNGENPIVITGEEVSYQTTSSKLLSNKPVEVKDNGSEQQLKNFIMNLNTRVITSNEKITALFTPSEKNK